MKRWEDFLKEEPTRELTASTEQRVFQEMRELAPKRYFWLRMAALAFGFAGVVVGYRLVHQEESPQGGELLELAEDSDLDLETLEDLDVIEILEDLEEWTA